MFSHFVLLSSLITLFGGALSSEPSRQECVEHLYRGFRRMDAFHVRMGRLGHQVMTCESLKMVLDLWVREFNEAGCRWGTMPNGVFEARFLYILRYLISTECANVFGDTQELRDLASSFEGNTCSPMDELFTGLEEVWTCLERRGVSLRTIMWAPGATMRACTVLREAAPCFEGAVDDCHDDNGEASNSVADAMAALMGSKLATPFAGGRRVEFKRQMEECQGADLGVFSPVPSLDLDWTPDGLPPDEDMLEALGSGNHLIGGGGGRLGNFLRRLEGVRRRAEAAGAGAEDGENRIE